MLEMHEIIRDLKKENRNIREELRHIRNTISSEKPKIKHLPGYLSVQKSHEDPLHDDPLHDAGKSHDASGPGSHVEILSHDDDWPLDDQDWHGTAGGSLVVPLKQKKKKKEN